MNMKLNGLLKSSGVALITLCTFYLTSCSIQDHPQPVVTPVVVDDTIDGLQVKVEVDYQPTKIPANLQDLFFYPIKRPVQFADLKDTVVVYLEGGPLHISDTSAVQVIKETLIDSVAHGNYSVLGLYQAHFMNINPTVFGSGSRFTVQNATEVNQATLTMLERAINWLKSGKKTVIVLGFSNGSLLVENYLTTGKTLADYFIIAATRLIPPPEIIQAYANDKGFEYVSDNQVVTYDLPRPNLSYHHVVLNLQLDGLKDYTSLLAGKPSLSRLFYLVGTHDRSIGVLTVPERAFLDQNKIPYVFTTKYGGDHHGVMTGVPQAIAYFRKK